MLAVMLLPKFRVLLELIFFSVYLFIFERKRERGKERARQRILSRLRAVNTKPDVGLELTNYEIMT